jgi:hypothetical protein
MKEQPEEPLNYDSRENILKNHYENENSFIIILKMIFPIIAFLIFIIIWILYKKGVI